MGANRLGLSSPAIIFEIATHTITVGNIAPTTVCMVALPAAVLGKPTARIMAKPVGVSPFVACFVTQSSGYSTCPVATTESMLLTPILIIAPGVMVGYLLKVMEIRLIHTVAGNAIACLVNTDADLGFCNVFPHVAVVGAAVAVAFVGVNFTTGNNNFF